MSFTQIFFFVHLIAFSASELTFKYHNNVELELFLKDFVQTSPDLKTRLYSIGTSNANNNLWVVEISAIKTPKYGVPNIKLIGNIHGNEAVGRELLLHFLVYLRDNYRNIEEVGWLLNNTKIHILPSLNPDGFAMAKEDNCNGSQGRLNGNGKMDLNRNFPDYFKYNQIPQARETQAVIQWMKQYPFILSAGLHGGAMVANYPFDTVKERKTFQNNQASLTPDNDVFKHLAMVYSQNHLIMHNGIHCSESSPGFKGGITNGAEWYSFAGGMQDYNYAFHGCMEITLEISCCKYPKHTELPSLWNQNKMALLKFCQEALHGVTGRITDKTTNQPVVNATLKIGARNMPFHTSKDGEFWRILLPGKYDLHVEAPGYYPIIQAFRVTDYHHPKPNLTHLDIKLVNETHVTTPSTTILPTFITTLSTGNRTNKTTDGSVQQNSTLGAVMTLVDGRKFNSQHNHSITTNRTKSEYSQGNDTRKSSANYISCNYPLIGFLIWCLLLRIN